jgi:nucleoside diphosphate kinase
MEFFTWMRKVAGVTDPANAAGKNIRITSAISKRFMALLPAAA